MCPCARDQVCDLRAELSLNVESGVCVCVMCGKSGLWCLSLLNKGCQNLNKPSSDLSEASKAFKSFLLK